MKTPICYYCDIEMTLLTKDRCWHVCPQCFVQEPRQYIQPRLRRLGEPKENASGEDR